MSAKQEKRLVSIRVIRGRKGRDSKYRLRVAGEQSRREFLRDASLSIAGVAAGATIPGMIASKARAADPDKKLGFALCGLGSLSTNQIAPALQKTRNCRHASKGGEMEGAIQHPGADCLWRKGLVRTRPGLQLRRHSRPAQRRQGNRRRRDRPVRRRDGQLRRAHPHQ